MTKNFKLNPTMTIITQILNDYVAENKPKEFELIEIYQIIRNDYNLEICIHSVKSYLDTLTTKNIIRCLKNTGKYRLPSKVNKFEPTPAMTTVLNILKTCTLDKKQVELDFSKIYNCMKKEYDICEKSLGEDLKTLVDKNKIIYLKKEKTYKLKMTKSNREKELIVA